MALRLSRVKFECRLVAQLVHSSAIGGLGLCPQCVQVHIKVIKSNTCGRILVNSKVGGLMSPVEDPKTFLDS